MKKQIFTALLFSCVCTMQAQENIQLKANDYKPDKVPLMSPIEDKSTAAEVPLIKDTLLLPPLNYAGNVSRYPYTGTLGGWSDWDLHSGLNASLSTSVTVGLGHNSYSGFSQSIALMYAASITPKLSLAVGGYYSHFNWSGNNQYSDASISAVLGYKFDEHWEAYIFAQKSIMTPKMPMPLYDISGIGDKIGAAVRYNFSPSFSVGVSVWHETYPDGYNNNPFNRPFSGEDYSAPR